MRNYLLLNLLCLFSIGSSIGQITYTNASFPQAGDITETTTAIDSLLQVTAPSAVAQVWDFSGLVAVNTTIDTIEAASSGASFSSFPSSDILQPFIGNIGGTAYVDVTSNQIVRIGGGTEIIGLSFIAPYVNPHITQVVPLTYPNTASDTYKWAYGQHIDSIPFLRSLIDSLVTLPFGSADSIRIAVEGDENRSVDAFGSCVMVDSTYDVLRQKIVTDVEIKIEVYMSIFTGGFWFDATPFLATSLPFPTNTTIVRYDFLAEGVKQPIVSLTLDSAELVVVNIEFLLGDTTTIGVQYIENELEAQIFPNPAQQIVHIQVKEEMPTGGYSLFLVDMLGRNAMVEHAIRNENHQVDISNITNGHYVVVLRNGKGEILKRQQLDIQH